MPNRFNKLQKPGLVLFSLLLALQLVACGESQSTTLTLVTPQLQGAIVPFTSLPGQMTPAQPSSTPVIISLPATPTLTPQSTTSPQPTNTPVPKSQPTITPLPTANLTPAALDVNAELKVIKAGYDAIS